MAKKEKVLLHTCCAPCSTYTVEHLTNEHFDITGLFYNPNIHPYKEYERRLLTVKLFSSLKELPMIYLDSYELEDFLQEIVNNDVNRCELCYRLRLRQTAKAAKKEDFKCFTTSLLSSPYQKHEVIKAVGKNLEKEMGIKFLYFDLRKHWDDNMKIAKEMNLFRQQYCGCVFSEKERYFKKKIETDSIGTFFG
jgi:predicted adenine nucleotide alpha hydrolase (AANH) superfamily ATPase